jgi:PAS domain S-box-containing protein
MFNWDFRRSLDYLTRPAPGITSEEQSRQARFVAALSLAVFIIGTIVFILWLLANPNSTVVTWITLISVFAFALSYGISRTRYYAISGLVLVTIELLFVAFVILTVPDEMSERMRALNNLALVVLFASLTLSLGLTLIVAIACLVIVALFFLALGVPFSVTYAYFAQFLFIFLLIIIMRLIQGNYIRRLQESQQRYSALFEKSNDAIFIFDLDGIYQDVNNTAAALLGYTREELIGSSYLSIVAPSEYVKSADVLERLKNDEHVSVYERIFQKKDGTTFPVEINVVFVRDTNGNPLHFQGIVRDITERKQAEINLREGTEYLQAIIDNAPFGGLFYKLTDENQLIFRGANPAAERILGIDYRGLVGKPLRMLSLDCARPKSPKLTGELHGMALSIMKIR